MFISTDEFIQENVSSYLTYVKRQLVYLLSVVICLLFRRNFATTIVERSMTNLFSSNETNDCLV